MLIGAALAASAVHADMGVPSAERAAVAQSGTVEQNIRDSASSALAKKPFEAGVMCRGEPRGPFAGVQNQGGGGVLGAGIGLASLAVLTASASLLSSSGDLFRPACESRGTAAAGNGTKGLSFAAPGHTPARTVTE